MASGTDIDDPENKAMKLRRCSGDPDFMLSFAKGLAVLEAFGSEIECPTIAKISGVTGLSRAAVRRCLYTLSQLGYASTVSGQDYAANTRLSTVNQANGLRRRMEEKA
jgi:IclR family pca regulon transcriptional regulator